MLAGTTALANMLKQEEPWLYGSFILFAEILSLTVKQCILFQLQRIKN